LVRFASRQNEQRERRKNNEILKQVQNDGILAKKDTIFNKHLFLTWFILSVVKDFESKQNE